MALVGYDNWEVFSAQSRPPLTTIDLDLQEIGASAARHLFAALNGERASGDPPPHPPGGARVDRSAHAPLVRVVGVPGRGASGGLAGKAFQVTPVGRELFAA